MSPRKLTDADKEELLIAYRETAETTSTLAVHYGVSSSTISRFLKSRLTTEEYEDLIQQKRLGRSNSVNKVEKSPDDTPELPLREVKSDQPKLVKTAEAITPEVESGEMGDGDGESASRRVRRRSPRSPVVEPEPEVVSAAPAKVKKIIGVEKKVIIDRAIPKPEIPATVAAQEPELEEQDRATPDLAAEDRFTVAEVNPDLLALAQEIGLGDRQQALNDLLGDDIDDDYDDDDDLEDDDEDDEDDDETQDIVVAPPHQPEAVQIFPLEEARFPRTCYIVTDRLSELVTRPMKDFRDLGHIPDGEVYQKTLPIFDNHRVAKRFIHGRSQKVIKIPNNALFTIASRCLTAKGITRLLINGKVYGL